MLNVLADKYIYEIEKILPKETALTLFDPQEPLQKMPTGTQALLIRTTTKIDSHFIARFPSSLQLVATASAGTDHVEIDALHKQNIAFANAAGCNARAVAEYVATAVIIWAEAKNIQPQTLTAGIIGAGNTGSETQKLLTKLGLKTAVYDPPKANREEAFQSASLDEVLRCDMLTFHVPLTFTGDYRTFHWFDEKKLNRPFKLIINASRGGVVDEQALLKAHKNKRVDDYILDVWKNEPVFDDDAAKNAFIHTPHIAGYSIQAKLKASKMVADALCQHFKIVNKNTEQTRHKRKIKIGEPPSITDLLKELHPIYQYHQKFSVLIDQSDECKKKGFNQIRAEYPLRNEYRTLDLPKNIRNRFPFFDILE